MSLLQHCKKFQVNKVIQFLFIGSLVLLYCNLQSNRFFAPTTTTSKNKTTKDGCLSSSSLLPIDAMNKSLQTAWLHMQELCPDSNVQYMDCVRKFPNFILSKQQQQQRSFDTSREITLVTHGTVSKLDRLLTQAKWWGGPISAAIYIDEADTISTFLQFVASHQDLPLLDNITLHVLLADGEPHHYRYPHNMLRNLALDSARTDYVVPIDAGFVTNPGAHDKLVDLIETDTDVRERLHSKFMFALPPFNVLPRAGETAATEDMIPKTKEEIINGIKNGTIRRFYNDTNVGTDKFHEYESWYNGYSHNKTFKEVLYRESMEPYVLAYRHALPHYYEQFRGFGFDKTSWFWTLSRIHGFEFCVLQDFYVAHLFHPPVTPREFYEGTTRNKPIYRQYKEMMRPLAE